MTNALLAKYTELHFLNPSKSLDVWTCMLSRFSKTSCCFVRANGLFCNSKILVCNARDCWWRVCTFSLWNHCPKKKNSLCIYTIYTLTKHKLDGYNSTVISRNRKKMRRHYQTVVQLHFFSYFLPFCNNLFCTYYSKPSKLIYKKGVQRNTSVYLTNE